jgi:SNF2 family DNA or RNA helicase
MEHVIFLSENTSSSNESADLVAPPPSKTDVILSILLENRDAKTIIFSSYQETFDMIRETLQEHGIHFGEIRGLISARERVIHEFKHGNLPVLFLKSMECGAGLDLKEATHIILYHPMPDSLFTQIRGRAYRIGRTLPLTIHHLN